MSRRTKYAGRSHTSSERIHGDYMRVMVSYPTLHVPFAYSASRAKQGRAVHVHRLVTPRILWRHGRPLELRGSFACMPSSWAGPLAACDGIPDGMVGCARCGVGSPHQPDGPVVYFATAKGMFKVGHTSDLNHRMANMHAELHLWARGTRSDETAIKRLIKPWLVRGTEWFAICPESEAVVRDWFAARAEPSVAS